MKMASMLFMYLLWLTPSIRAQQAQITFHIKDDAGISLSNALVVVSIPVRKISAAVIEYVADNNRLSEVISDTNGLANFRINCDYGRLTYSVNGERNPPNSFFKMSINGVSYYANNGINYSFTKQVSDRWQPWNPTIELSLRRVLNPVPMYVKDIRMDVSPFPALDENLGYDLEKGDWLSPYGIGQTADFIFRVHCDWSEEKSPYGEQYYHATMELTFSNVDDGIIEFRDSQPELEGSIYRLPRFAPESGYTNRWASERFLNEEGSTWATISQRKNLNYFFRVRTKNDEMGKIVSAHYGKIRGPLDFGFRGKRNGLSMTYYLNPTPNDRNMEFDPKRNLFTDLKVGEQVQEP